MVKDHFIVHWNATSKKCPNVQDRLSSIFVTILWLLRTSKSLLCFALHVRLLKIFFFPFYLASGNQAGKQQQQQHYLIVGMCNVLLLALRILVIMIYIYIYIYIYINLNIYLTDYFINVMIYMS